MENKDFGKLLSEQESLNKLIEKNTASMGSFMSAQANAVKLSKQLRHSEKMLNEQIKKAEDSRIRLEKVKLKLKEDIAELNYDEIANLRAEEEVLEKQIKLLDKQISYHDTTIKKYKAQYEIIKKSLTGWNNIGSTIKNEIGSALKAGWSNMLDQDKAVRKTQLSMGILSNQATAFSMNIYKASARTQMLGASAKDLAGYQKDYSEQIGRSIVLSDKGLESITEIAKGTTLGSEGATKLAAGMDNFGISATASRDIVEETVNLAHKMGVNASSVSKRLLDNLRYAQKYSFKEGMKSMQEMAVQGEKFRVSMESVAGFADKLFTPEGAIDAAAQLQVLGGEWAKIADPFSLMYKARHDMAGLQKSMIEATAGVAKFNKETGTFDISGMELHKLREISKVTGQSLEELAESAKEVAKTKEIKMRIGATVDKTYEDFITSTAQYDKEKGGYFIEIGAKKINIKDLSDINNEQLRNLVLEKENLKKRALESEGFDELWTNLKDSFKATLLPLLKGIELGLRKPLMSVIEWLDKNDITTKIANLAETIGTFIADNPFKSVILALGGLGLFEAGKWFLNGIALRKGFEVGGGLNSGLGGKIGVDGVLGGIGLGLAGTGLQMGRNLRDNPNDDIGKAMGVGGSALQGAGIGLALGSVIPVIGNAVGAAVGGVLGAGYGLYNEYSQKDELAGAEPVKMQDFVMRPGSKAQPFSNNDTIIGFKPDGPILKNSKDNTGNNVTSGTIKVEFTPMKIEFGEIKVVTDNGYESKINILNNSVLMQELSVKIQEELRKSIGGGVLNPNPIK